MDAERYRAVQEIFIAAIEQPASEREAHVEAACATDPSLRGEVHAMLAQYAADESADANPFGETQIEVVRAKLEGLLEDPSDAPLADVPVRIEGYTIHRLIGVGGMGVVYEAMQTSPRRRVAMKLLDAIKPAPDRMRRFAQEAELLGRLQHPGIAQVFEAGTADHGRGAQPYFAMEFVDGVDVRTYCDREGLDVRARAELIAKVCDAVHYAHGQGVIHRDVKPENVLVNEHGQPKVLDFGIARATDASTILSTIVTEEGQLLGTLPYMAPEQLRAAPEAVTNRVDIYAIGVLAYEIFAGRRPHAVEDLTISSAIAVLANADAPRLAKLDPRFKGDLDTIVGKALEADPARRYPTAAAMGGDFRRHLDEQPITARPPTRAYRARKFVRRNRTLVAGAASTAVVLTLGLIVSLMLADAERSQRQRADDALRVAQRETEFAGGMLLQTAVRYYESDAADRELLAVEALGRVPESVRGWGWRLLSAGLPPQLPRQFGAPAHLDGDRLCGLENGRLRIMTVGLDDGLRDIFPDLQVAQWGNATSSGLVVVQLDDGGTRLLDLINERVIAHGPAYPPYGDAVSDNGELVLWRTGAHEAELRRGGDVVLTIGDLPSLPSSGFARDLMLLGAGILVRVEADGVAVIDLVTGEVGPNVAIDEGVAVSEVVGFDHGVLLESGAKRLAVDLSDSPPRRGAVFSVGDRNWLASISDDGRVASFSGWGSSRVLDPWTGAPIGPTRHTDESGILRFRHGNLGLTFPDAEGRFVYMITWRADLLEPPTSSVHDPRCLVLTGEDEWYHVAVSHDGSLIAAAGPWHEEMRLWDARTGERVASRDIKRDIYQTQTMLMAFGAGDDRLHFTTPIDGRSSDQPRVVSWDLIEDSDEVVHQPEIDRPDVHTGLIDTFIDVLDPGPRARLSQASQMLGDTAIYTGKAMNAGELLTPPFDQWDGGEHWRYSRAERFGGIYGITGLSVHPTESLLAVVRFDVDGRSFDRRSGFLEVYDEATGQREHQVRLPFRPWCVAYSPDGERLVIGGNDGNIIVVDTDFYLQRMKMRAHRSYVYSVAWLPDGERLVTVSGDRQVRVWDPNTSRVRQDAVASWRSVRAEMAARPDLKRVYPTLEGDERAAARIELLLRRERAKETAVSEDSEGAPAAD